MSQFAMIYKGFQSDELRVSFYDGKKWTKNSRIADQNGSVSPKSGDAVTTSSFKNLFYIFYKGSGNSEDIFVTMFNGIEWTGDKKINDLPGGIAPRTNYGPASIVYKDTLHLIYIGTDNRFNDTTFDGTSWSEINIIKIGEGYPKTNHGVNAVVFADRIFIVYKGESDEELRWMSYNGSKWEGDKKISETGDKRIYPKTNGSNPGIVSYNGMLNIFYKGIGSEDKIYTASFDGASWSGNTILEITGQDPRSSEAPRAFAYDENGPVLRIVYKGKNTGGLYTACKKDGVWSGNLPISTKDSGNPESTHVPAVSPVLTALGAYNWMTNHVGVIGDKPFARLTLPSSHDSGMHVIRGPAINIEEEGRGTRTQELDIYSQLVFGGARVLDIRPVYYEKSISGPSSGYYAAHYSLILGSTLIWAGLVGQTLDEICSDLKQALAILGDNEVVVIHVSHGGVLKEGKLFETLPEDRQKDIVQKLLTACSGHLFTARNDETVDFFGKTPLEFTNLSGKAAVFFVLTDNTFSAAGKSQADGCFGLSSCNTHSTWGKANTDKAAEFYDRTFVALKDTYPVEDGKLLLAWQLTWSPFDSRSLEEFAAEINPALGVKLDAWKERIPSENRPAMIGWNFVKPVWLGEGIKDPTFEAVMRYNDLYD